MEETGKQVCKILPELCKRKGNGGNYEWGSAVCTTA